MYINSLFNNPEKTGDHSSFKLGMQDSFESIFILIFLLKNEGAGLLGLSFCPDDCDFFFFFFLAVLGLRFCARAFSSCGKLGPLFITVRGPLTVAASPFAEHNLQTRRLSSCGSRA